MTLWKSKEEKYEARVGNLQKRADDLAGILHRKDDQIEKLKHSQATHLQHIEILKCQLEPKKKPGLYDQPRRVMSQTWPSTSIPKLPPLVKGPNEQTEIPYAKKTHEKHSRDLRPSQRGLPATVTGAIPSEVQHESGIRCSMVDKWIDDSGGRLQLPNTEVCIPAQSVHRSVYITATEVYDNQSLLDDISQCGLQTWLQPAARVVLQPHGMRFSRPVQITIKNTRAVPGRLLILHKNVDHFAHTEWNDITASSSVKTHKDGIGFSVDHFSIFQVLKVLAPVATLAVGVFAAGMAVGQSMRSPSVNPHVLAVLNGKTAECNASIFHDTSMKTLTVLLTTSTKTMSDIERRAHSQGLTSHIKTQPTTGLCDGETLFFIYDKHGRWQKVSQFDLQQAKTTGQIIHLPLDVYHPSRLPRNMTIRRHLTHNIPDMDVCFLDLLTALQKKDKSKTPGVNALRQMRPKLVEDIDVRYLMDHMMQEHVINDEEKQMIENKKTRQAQTRYLLDLLSSKGDKGVFVLVRSLDHSYQFLAKEFREYIPQIPLTDRS